MKKIPPEVCALCHKGEPKWIVQDPRMRNHLRVKWDTDDVKNDRDAVSFLCCDTCRRQIRRYKRDDSKVSFTPFVDSAGSHV